MNWAYRFDSAVQSPSGKYAAIYERVGTKGLLIEGDRLVRELNRSFYCANAYQYPVTFFRDSSGREMLVHCPEHYNRLEIEDVVTGERLTACEGRNPEDFFHSRLAVSPGGKRLLSAGWIWHPFDAICVYDIKRALADPREMDDSGGPGVPRSTEVNAAAFIDDDRVVVTCNSDGECFDDDEGMPWMPGHVGVFDLVGQELVSVARVGEDVGEMMAVDERFVVGFDGFPRLIDLRSGEVVMRWEDIATGRRRSSIVWDHKAPALAVAREHRRFAVAGEKGITIVELGEVG